MALPSLNVLLSIAYHRDLPADSRSPLNVCATVLLRSIFWFLDGQDLIGHLISSKRGRRWIPGHPLDCGVEDVHLLRLGIVFTPGPVCRRITLGTGSPLIHPNLGRQGERRSLTPGFPFGALGGFKRRDLLTLPLIE